MAKENIYNLSLLDKKEGPMSKKDIIHLAMIGKYLIDIISNQKQAGVCNLSDNDLKLAEKIYKLFDGDSLLTLKLEEDDGNRGILIDNYYIFDKEYVNEARLYLGNLIKDNGYVDGNDVIGFRRSIVISAKEIIDTYKLRSQIMDLRYYHRDLMDTGG